MNQFRSIAASQICRDDGAMPRPGVWGLWAASAFLLALHACSVEDVTFKNGQSPLVEEDCDALGDEDGNGQADCEDAACAAHPQCQLPPTCTDGKKNGNETDIDCGGGSCPACGAGKACVEETDCGGSGVCDARACRAAVSCLEIYGRHPGTRTGVYAIAPGGSAPFSVFCDMAPVDGGWTLLLKADGAVTLAGIQPSWTDDTTLNPADLTLLPGNSKYDSFNKLPVTVLRGELDGYRFRQSFNQATARQIFSGASAFVQPYPFFNTGGANWSTQPNCQSFGINISYPGSARGFHVRFGWSANQEPDCLSNDTIIGLGGNRGAGYLCASSECNAGLVNTDGNGLLWGR